MTDTLVVLNPRDNGNAQGAFPGADDDWYIAIDKGDYMLLERHDRTPPDWRDQVKVVGKPGHITSTSWRDDGLGGKGEIWTTFGTRVCFFPYVKNATITKDDVTFVDVFHKGGIVQISLALDGLTAVVRTHASGYSYFRLYLVADLLAGHDRQIGKTIRIKRTPVGSRVEQSFGVSGDTLWTGYGASKHRCWFEARSFTTGDRPPDVDDVDVTTVGAKVSSSSWQELENAPGDLTCKKVGTGSSRRIVVSRRS